MAARASLAWAPAAPAVDLPMVSIVIPTFNEERFLPRCLESVARLDYPADKVEVIVVDNGSTDRTVEIARRHTPLVYVKPGASIARLRNFGCEEARGGILAFLDADCVAERDWLRNAVPALVAEGCVTGSAYLVPRDGTWVEKAWFAQRPKGRTEVRAINAGNLLVPATVFRQVRGFREDLPTAEDDDFCLRVRNVARVVSDDSVSVTHLGNPKTVGQFMRREIWLGCGSGRWLAGRWHAPVLVATLLFALATGAQALGLVLGLAGVGWAPLAVASAAVAALLLSSVYHRRAYLRSLAEVPPLLLLYYVFYAARAIGLGYFLSGRRFHRRK